MSAALNITFLHGVEEVLHYDNMDQARFEKELSEPKNVGEMADADAVGTVGSPDCGDMLRMWIKFKEKNGQKVIDRASFQSFGCQTAIAVASMATELLKGKSIEEAGKLQAEELTGELGALPPMKIHCGQLVEGALKQALGQADIKTEEGADKSTGQPLASSLVAPESSSVKIVFEEPKAES